MIVSAVSDLHGNLPHVEECDLLLIAGDVCPDYAWPPVTTTCLTRQAGWLANSFAPWLESVPARHIVGIAGNHDFVFEHPDLIPDLPWTYLHDSMAEVDGLGVWGSPWVPNLPRWAFHKTATELTKYWQAVPPGIDILMTHGPPAGYGDVVSASGHVGCPALGDQLAYIRPRLHVFGHIHEGRGTWGKLGPDSTLHANVSLVDIAYNPVYQPMRFEL